MKTSEMSPELRRALESIADLQGRPVEDIYSKIRLRKKKEIVVEWTSEPVRYLPVKHEMENISWMMYWMREEFKRLYRLEAERIQWEMDNELLYGIHWKIRRPDLEQLYRCSS